MNIFCTLFNFSPRDTATRAQDAHSAAYAYRYGDQPYYHNLMLWVAYNNAVAATIPGFVYPPSGTLHALAAYGLLDPDIRLAPLIASNFYAVHLYRLYNTSPPPPPTFFYSVPELALTADLDGDGFSNLDEWLYLNHVMDNPLDDVADWLIPGAEDIALLATLSSTISNQTAVLVCIHALASLLCGQCGQSTKQRRK